jgi:Anti-sigma factor NepR
MHDDDQLPAGRDAGRKPRIADASELPAALGEMLRALFTEVESQPVPDRLRELVEALAAKESKAE